MIQQIKDIYAYSALRAANRRYFELSKKLSSWYRSKTTEKFVINSWLQFEILLNGWMREDLGVLGLPVTFFSVSNKIKADECMQLGLPSALFRKLEFVTKDGSITQFLQ